MFIYTLILQNNAFSISHTFIILVTVTNPRTAHASGLIGIEYLLPRPAMLEDMIGYSSNMAGLGHDITRSDWVRLTTSPTHSLPIELPQGHVSPTCTIMASNEDSIQNSYVSFLHWEYKAFPVLKRLFSCTPRARRIPHTAIVQKVARASRSWSRCTRERWQNVEKNKKTPAIDDSWERKREKQDS